MKSKSLSTILTIVTLFTVTSCSDNNQGKFINLKCSGLDSTIQISQTKSSNLYEIDNKLDTLINSKASFFLYIYDSSKKSLAAKASLESFIKATENVIYSMHLTTFRNRNTKAFDQIPVLSYNEMPCLIAVNRGVVIDYQLSTEKNGNSIFSSDKSIKKYVESKTYASNIYSLMSYGKLNNTYGGNYYAMTGKKMYESYVKGLTSSNNDKVIFYSSINYEDSQEEPYTNNVWNHLYNEVIYPFARKYNNKRIYIFDIYDTIYNNENGKYVFDKTKLNSFLKEKGIDITDDYSLPIITSHSKDESSLPYIPKINSYLKIKSDNLENKLSIFDYLIN